MKLNERIYMIWTRNKAPPHNWMRLFVALA
uniref:Uncharacterized protein n=1 Tax=Lepeophtheirus salmonis TaxID=72036 RepID=A0A0K2U869_LEPSM